MMSYLSCGNIMSDIIIQPNGFKGEKHIGGPALFGLSGIKLWTDNCKIVTGTGANYQNDYGKWFDDNSLSKESVRVAAERVTCYQIAYNHQGRAVMENSFSYYGDQNMGYLKTHPRHIDEAASADTKGIYMAQGADRVVWQKLAAIKKRHNFKIMWELEHFNSGKNLEKILDVMPIADAWSLNHSEAAELFGLDIDNDEGIIKRLQQMPIPLTFYRVGKRGAFLITPSEVYFCESIDVGQYVDQTGCGNSSTGSAMYAHFSGHSLPEVLVMANLAAGFNCLQYGPYPLYTKEVQQMALALKNKHLAKVVRI